MKHVSKKAIDTLTDDNITSECCRGPITDAIAQAGRRQAARLAGDGELGRGWSASTRATRRSSVVGTRGPRRQARRAGRRRGGDIPHGSTDLFGHEAGHAFDAANGGGKKDNAAFLAARSADIAAGKAGGGMAGKKNGGSDDYFLTEAEGGANNDGSTSETFAESFAMYLRQQPLEEAQRLLEEQPVGI